GHNRVNLRDTRENFLIPHQIILTSYGVIRNDIDFLKGIKFNGIIIDESTNIKNSNSKIAKAFYQLKGVFRIALSGTPIENRLEELWSLFNFLNPGLLGSLRDFRKTFVTPIEKYKNVEKIKKQKNIIDPLYYGKLFIDANSKALTSAIYSLNLDNEKLARDLFVRKKPNRVDVEPVVANYRVDYREKDGKWYYGYSNIQLEFVVDWKGRLFNSRYRINSEMLITDWQNETSALALQADEKFNSRSILADEASGFADPNFWGSYNVIEPDKSIQSAIEKIQRQLRKE
ncbi:hypothetical protein LCGC14_2459500, partial [marine sediment metagenome]